MGAYFCQNTSTDHWQKIVNCVIQKDFNGIKVLLLISLCLSKTPVAGRSTSLKILQVMIQSRHLCNDLLSSKTMFSQMFVIYFLFAYCEIFGVLVPNTRKLCYCEKSLFSVNLSYENNGKVK